MPPKEPKGKQLKKAKNNEGTDSESKRTRSANWTSQETKILIELLRDNFEDFRKAKRKNGVYQKIWKEAKVLGVDRTVKQISDRHKVLHNKFKSEKKEHSSTGSSPSEWEFYEACASFMNDTALNNHTTLDSLDGSLVTEDGSSREDNIDIATPSTSGNSASKAIRSSSSEDEAEEGSETEPFTLGNSEEDELQAKLNPPPKKLLRLAGQKNKKVKLSFAEVVRDEMNESRKASAVMQETLNTALSGFAPLMQSLGASLQFLPQLLQQPQQPFYPPHIQYQYPPGSAPIQQHPLPPPPSYPHQHNQGFIPPYDHQYQPPPYYVQQNNLIPGPPLPAFGQPGLSEAAQQPNVANASTATPENNSGSSSTVVPDQNVEDQNNNYEKL